MKSTCRPASALAKTYSPTVEPVTPAPKKSDAHSGSGLSQPPRRPEFQRHRGPGTPFDSRRGVTNALLVTLENVYDATLRRFFQRRDIEVDARISSDVICAAVEADPARARRALHFQ